jgi:hypothetical protein
MSSISSIGSTSSALQSAQLGIQRGMANVSRDDQVVAQGASTGVGTVSVTGALVDAKQQALNVEASARAMSITDQTLGTLLDIKA